MTEKPDESMECPEIIFNGEAVDAEKFCLELECLLLFILAHNKRVAAFLKNLDAKALPPNAARIAKALLIKNNSIKNLGDSSLNLFYYFRDYVDPDGLFHAVGENVKKD